MIGDIEDWEVIPGLINSDHRLIKFKIKSEIELINKKTFRYDKADWDKFRLALTDLYKGHLTPNTWNERTLEKLPGREHQESYEACDTLHGN